METELMRALMDRNIEEVGRRRKFFLKTATFYIVAKEVCRRKGIEEDRHKVVAKVAFCDNLPILRGIASQISHILEEEGEAGLGKTLEATSFICSKIMNEFRDVSHVEEGDWEAWIESL